ncbi:MAG: hypothetical protein A4E28_02454 [Methanocella sp. PtaU1.Bin125]|nr:MAG: hypothetical protein A4E28_02454 [Methanocella sp. PtaU1.Bin125]
MRLSRLLLSTSIICYVLYDIVSTLAAYAYLGSFEYEKSVLIKSAFELAGVPGFIAIKMTVSLIAIAAAFMLMERYVQFRGLGVGVLSGATLAGLFVGTSNMNILVQGSSIWLLGMDSGTVAAIIICGCSLGGFLMPERVVRRLSRPEPAEQL